jgi:probable HAF family extracellular repeat protein
MPARQFVFLPLVLLFLALVGTPRAAIPPDADDADFVPVDLGTLGGSISAAAAVNARRQVVGYSATADGTRHAFLWTAIGGMVDLGGGVARAVNAHGQVVGVSIFPTAEAGHAFSWTARGGMVDLGTLGGFFSQANAVNARGQVVGFGTPTPAGAQHAVLWDVSR